MLLNVKEWSLRKTKGSCRQKARWLKNDNEHMDSIRRCSPENVTDNEYNLYKKGSYWRTVRGKDDFWKRVYSGIVTLPLVGEHLTWVWACPWGIVEKVKWKKVSWIEVDFKITCIKWMMNKNNKELGVTSTRGPSVLNKTEIKWLGTDIVSTRVHPAVIFFLSFVYLILGFDTNIIIYSN